MALSNRKKVLLTIPALLAGPLLVLLIAFTLYDFSAAGGLFTMLLVSFAAVKSLWSKDADPAPPVEES